MIAPPVPLLGQTLGPAAFAALSWGAIGLILVVFAYVAWALVVDRESPG